MTTYGHCHYCKHQLTRPTATNHGRRMATRDHVVPASRGGRRTVPCCWQCNNIKADMMPDEWARYRVDNPDWHKAEFSPLAARERKAAQRAEIFQQLRIKAISPAWPLDIYLPPRPLCRGLDA